MQDLSNNTKKSLRTLASLAGLSTKYGWIKALAKWLGVKEDLVSTWISRDKIPLKRLRQIEEKGHPRVHWLVSYDETQENMSTPNHSREGDNLWNHTRHVEHEGNHFAITSYNAGLDPAASAESWYFKALDDIFKSKDSDAIFAMKSAIRACWKKLTSHVEIVKRLEYVEYELKELRKKQAKKKKQNSPAAPDNAG